MSPGKIPLGGPLLEEEQCGLPCVACLMRPASCALLEAVRDSVCSTGDRVPCPGTSLGFLRSQACAVARDFHFRLLVQTNPFHSPGDTLGLSAASQGFVLTLPELH